MLTIYTPIITPRIAFIMNVIFKGHLKIAFHLTDSTTEFHQAEIKLSYSTQPVSSEIFICRHPLSIETEIKEQSIDLCTFEDETVFFQTFHNRSLLAFDIFSFAFFLLSRYEEYLPHKKDKYKRFPGSESIAYKLGFLQKPLVDIVVLKFAKKLQEAIPELKFGSSQAEYIATYDIDHAYAYKYKGIIRSIGGGLKNAARFNLKEVADRIAVLLNLKQDPFDTYEYIRMLQDKYHIDTYYFILFSEKAKYDRGLNPRNTYFHRLLEQLEKTGKVGCHPSFASNTNKIKLEKEISGLSSVLKKEIEFSRSHFLLLNFPETYNSFIETGIKCDFTLGYADQAGFRASTCKPFNFFDLSSNRETALRLYPFAYMEETLQTYMQLNANEGLSLIKQLIDSVISVNGVFISLWHNENFEKKGWNAWKKTYEQSIDYFFGIIP